jgi:hypothetical protein
MNDQIPAPGPQTILTGKGFIASVNRVAEFIRQWQRPSLTSNRRRDGVIYALHTDPAAEPIELTVDDLEVVLRRALPISYPDREELARELFARDNSRQSREQSRIDFDRLKREQAAAGEAFYVYPLADAAIEQFRRANARP